jgi:ABC-type arginine transport system permease subunit
MVQVAAADAAAFTAVSAAVVAAVAAAVATANAAAFNAVDAAALAAAAGCCCGCIWSLAAAHLPLLWRVALPILVSQVSEQCTRLKEVQVTITQSWDLAKGVHL